MKGFPGFPEGPVRMTPVPAPFFTDLLKQIDDLGELKLTLYVFWKFSQQEGSVRYLTAGALRADPDLAAALAAPGRTGERALADALERATARGTLLEARGKESGDAVYFLNSPRGKAAAESLARGEWRAQGAPVAARAVERPNVFTLYEQNIGMLTPMMAEILRDAEKEYPAAWIEEAIRIAVESNARKWRFVSAVLERWKQEGRGVKPASAAEEGRKYIEGEYADFIEH
jgi:DNA replication protein